MKIHFNNYLIEVVLEYILYLYIVTIETQRECIIRKLKIYYSLSELKSCVRLSFGVSITHERLVI